MPRFDWVWREGNWVSNHIFMSVLNTSSGVEEGFLPLLFFGEEGGSGAEMIFWSGVIKRVTS